MTQFVTMVRWKEGFASYTVSEGAQQYTAELIKSSSDVNFPPEIIIERRLVQQQKDVPDELTSKLIHVINHIETTE